MKHGSRFACTLTRVLARVHARRDTSVHVCVWLHRRGRIWQRRKGKKGGNNADEDYESRTKTSTTTTTTTTATTTATATTTTTMSAVDDGAVTRERDTHAPHAEVTAAYSGRTGKPVSALPAPEPRTPELARSPLLLAFDPRNLSPFKLVNATAHSAPVFSPATA